MSKYSEEVKQTNEIKVAAPVLDAIEIENKDITADALHTQWRFARHIVEERKAHYDEDRCRIRTGNDPENITRLRRFAISIIKSKKVYSVAKKMRELSFNTRAVFEYLKMTKKLQMTTVD